MSLTVTEITLQEALQDFGLRALPPEWTPNRGTTLVDGIALVVKSTGKEYARISNIDGKISVVKDYGKCSIIIQIEKIFAVNTITRADVPNFKNEAEIVHYLCKSKYDKAEVMALLSNEGKTESQIALDRKEIENRINDLTLSAQKRKIAERKRVDEIKEFAEKTKSKKRNERKESTKNRG